MDYQTAIVDLFNLFERNSAYCTLYAEAIKAAQQQIPEAQLVSTIAGLKTEANQTQDAAAILATLVRNGALTRTILVNGEVYEGTIEEMQKDETLPDSITVDYLVQATEPGMDTVKAYESSIDLDFVFSQRPQYVPGYLAVLEACMDEEGKSTDELQQMLCEAGILSNDFLGKQELHTSYFTGKLQSCKALVWDRKRWHTTPKGAAMVNASK